LYKSSVKIRIFWGMTSTRSVLSCRQFGSACCLHFPRNLNHQPDIITLKSTIFTTNAQNPQITQSTFVLRKLSTSVL